MQSGLWGIRKRSWTTASAPFTRRRSSPRPSSAPSTAQRFPADYDGIIAGAPAGFFTHIFAAFTLDIEATEADPAAYIPAAKLPAIESAVLSTCDALDGLKDGIIDDPRRQNGRD
jgi:hypothetical protein